MKITFHANALASVYLSLKPNMGKSPGTPKSKPTKG